MATNFIDFPPVHIQVPPHILKTSLHVTDPAKVKTVSDVYASLIEGGKHKPDHATSIARILTAHYGFLPDGFAKEVYGIETADLTKYGQLQRSIMTELYGKSSFLYEYVRGEVSADACAVSITNWDLCARQCDLVVAGETDQERLARVALGDRYRQAISQLQGYVKDAYVTAINEARQTLADKRTLTVEKFIAARRKPFFEEKRDEVIKPMYTALTFVANARELEMLKVKPLYVRKYAERRDFWKTRLNGDIISTMFRMAIGIVDLLTLFGRADWTQIWGHKLVVTMDCMHRKAIHVEMLVDSISVNTTDPQYRASINISVDRAGLNTTIRSFEKFVKEPAATWNWMNIPIIQATRKHSAPQCSVDNDYDEGANIEDEPYAF